MAVIRDVMPAFDLLQPTSADEAQKLLQQHGHDAWAMAGGLDSFDWLKDRIKKPKVLVDLSGIDELRGVRTTSDGGLEIGAMTTLTEVVNNPTIKQKFGLLSEGAELAASPQIRNQGTLGGNVSQDARCHYYRAGWPCYRAGGNICYADTPTGRNREHAILNANRCVAVNPSDSAPALDRARRQVRDQDVQGREGCRCRGLLHRSGHRHHAAEHPAAGRSAHGDPHSGDLGGSAVLFREGSRPQRVGLRAAERGLGHEGVGRHRSKTRAW